MESSLTTETPDLSGALQEAMDRDHCLDRRAFDSLWEQAGCPPDVRLSLSQARILQLLFPPTDFRPLDSDTFQLPFLRLHVSR